MKILILPIALQVMGVLVILAEIFIPSLGLLSALAAGLIFYSLFLAFTEVSRFAGLVFVSVDIVVVPVLIYIGMRVLAASSLSLQKELSSEEGVVSQAQTLEAWMNKKGKAVTDLRPSGMALIEGTRLDVVTDGEYVDAGAQIVVMQVKGNQIIVEKI